MERRARQVTPEYWPVRHRVLLAVVVCGAVTFTMSTMPTMSWLRRGLGESTLLWEGFASAGTRFLAGVLCWLRAGAAAGPGRRAWRWLAAGMMCWSSGSFISAWRFEPDIVPPVPAISDVGWLAFYPCAVIALWELVRQRMTRLTPAVWLDGATAAGGVAILTLWLVLGHPGATTVGEPLQVFFNLVYPLMDAVLVFLAVGAVAMLGWRPSRSWWLLSIGLLLVFAADAMWMIEIISGTIGYEGVENSWWVWAYVFYALASGGALSAEQAVRTAPPTAAVVPVAVAVLALAMLTLALLRPVPLAAAVAAALTVLLALLRLVVSLRQEHVVVASRREARTDELSGLPNRRALREHAQHVLASGERPAALLLLDLDRFKEVNDALGHAVGDQLLAIVAARLRHVLRQGELIARLGGDEFALLTTDTDATDATHVAARIRTAMADPIAIGTSVLQVQASIGIAVHPDHGRDLDELLQAADIAMYRAKRTRSGHHIYTPTQDAAARHRLHELAELRAAVTAGELLVHYQPQIDATTLAVTGVEALIRWRRRDGQVVAPASFLPLVEEAGLMPQLSEHVLQQTCRHLQFWRGAGLHLEASINLTAAEITPALPERLHTLLALHGLPARALLIELTEESLLTERSAARQVLEQLHDLGVRVAIDDFGTGHSTFTYLCELPVDQIKVDKSFVLPMLDDRRAGAAVTASVGLARALGIQTVAEGVETPALLRAAGAAGCDLLQGYHIARPMPADEIPTWAADWSRHHTIHPRPVLRHEEPT
ncbi:diguanylate cyclase (GGDEF)-like protein [Kineococcus xinjiangensis]|uniref:Diguanylate cyclase (GGDEF)-like protein n=1 Tax=Kineococcus xinjiangensis TaxID=512762 RepID=A0A2S6IDK9_9ACTN|nr:EAL domain-containing protein [Kineococcus xinjiangensis]PPK92263.1 diguanylate cyclase (GGDEF)-like protein [Kineococcus xinjiangensis]